MIIKRSNCLASFSLLSLASLSLIKWSCIATADYEFARSDPLFSVKLEGEPYESESNSVSVGGFRAGLSLDSKQ
jgi:hypothetical protein